MVKRSYFSNQDNLKKLFVSSPWVYNIFYTQAARIFFT